jgi:hypothetical protein
MATEMRKVFAAIPTIATRAALNSLGRRALVLSQAVSKWIGCRLRIDHRTGLFRKPSDFCSIKWSVRRASHDRAR